MSAIDLDDLKCKYDAATPGDWRAGAVEKGAVFGDERVLLRMNKYKQNDNDAVFIAEARNMFPALLDAARELVQIKARIAEAKRPFCECKVCAHASYVMLLYDTAGERDKARAEVGQLKGVLFDAQQAVIREGMQRDEALKLLERVEMHTATPVHLADEIKRFRGRVSS